MKYDVIYFINKFYAIPSDKWTTGRFFKKTDPTVMCALGHCGMYGPRDRTLESLELEKLIRENQFFYGRSAENINDGTIFFSELGTTPKERILNALLLIKAGVTL